MGQEMTIEVAIFLSIQNPPYQTGREVWILLLWDRRKRGHWPFMNGLKIYQERLSSCIRMRPKLAKDWIGSPISEMEGDLLDTKTSLSRMRMWLGCTNLADHSLPLFSLIVWALACTIWTSILLMAVSMTPSLRPTLSHFSSPFEPTQIEMFQIWSFVGELWPSSSSFHQQQEPQQLKSHREQRQWSWLHTCWVGRYLQHGLWSNAMNV